MEELKKAEAEYGQEQEGKSFFDFQTIYRTVVLNWYWFILSLIICVGLAAIYLRYTTPIYKTTAKLLIKDQENDGRAQSIRNMSTLGIMSNSAGIDNEMEILSSRTMAQDVVRDLKLYVTYATQGRVKSVPYYGNQPLNVDVDATHLETLNRPISLSISRNGSSYSVSGSYSVPIDEREAEGPFSLNKTFNSLPATINTRAGIITISSNNGKMLRDGESLQVMIQSPKNVANKYVGSLQVAQNSKSTTIAMLNITDEIPQRSIDYLKQLAVVYNRQANEDKNTVALRTDKFINARLEKINSELGETEGQIQSFKQNNGMVELKMNATNSFSNQTAAEQKLSEIEIQIELFNNIASETASSSRNLSQIIPSNIGLIDEATTGLINKYNELVLERNRLLRSASENSPVVEPLTDQIRTLNTNIKRSIETSRRNLEIQRDGILAQYNKYNSQVEETPVQERKMTEIGRQQEVRAGLYLMLLQKREENNISLAATVDKGKLLDDPQFAGQVSPNSSMIILAAGLIGLAVPALILFLIQLFRYKIEGHDDVARLTKLPILADVPVASNSAKGKADIIVQENQNNQMEEVFRSMRTNLQFILKEGQKVILFTSSTSGEGKTFTAANLAVSFALLGKKAVLVGLDIRRPRLAELFGLKDKKHGITNLLIKESIDLEDINNQIIPSEINKNLDLLLAGPVPPNPAELVARNSLDRIFGLLKSQYDYIIIDTAPVGLVTDTLQIGRVADTTVFLCRADYTPKATFEMINELSREKKLPKISIVINGIDMSKKKYGYYYGYGKYGKYGRYGSGKYGSSYGQYGNYSNSHYGNKNDKSIKR
ncbi:polysaccharide biosynthesis tyrosine autokinase [Prevotella sp. HUN102]|uniref:GumC family protein n=1 Tax=Prevotella sp. HUN102 TaxID=1392486 RepID=UPI00048A8E4E|nr:polysaccharide biosynthesis tyrosine autokinase [Prevotella sp. HUN102]